MLNVSSVYSESLTNIDISKAFFRATFKRRSYSSLKLCDGVLSQLISFIQILSHDSLHTNTTITLIKTAPRVTWGRSEFFIK